MFYLILSFVISCIPYTAYSDVITNVYDGYDYTIKERIEVKNITDNPQENVIQEIEKNKTNSDSPYHYDYDITYKAISSGAQIIEIRNEDSEEKFRRILSVKSLKPGEKIIYEVYYSFYNGKISYDVDKKEFDNYNYDEKKFAEYLKNEDKIEVDSPLIQEKTKEVIGNEKNPYVMAQKIFSFVNTYVKYDEKEKNKGALNALETGEGVCEDYATLFVAMCRAAGIPSRTVTGIWFKHDGQTNRYYDIYEIYHEWAEIYLPGAWLIVDPSEQYIERQGPFLNSFAKETSGAHFIYGYNNLSTTKVITRLEKDNYNKGYIWHDGINISISKVKSSMNKVLALINEMKTNNFLNYESLVTMIKNMPESVAKQNLTNMFYEVSYADDLLSYNIWRGNFTRQ